MFKQNETYRQYMVRLDSTYKHLKSHGVELPLEVRGWFLMRKLCLDQTQEALLLTATNDHQSVSEWKMHNLAKAS